MTLFEIISQLDNQSDRTTDDVNGGLSPTIYVARVGGKWLHDSQAVVAVVEGGDIRQSFEGVPMEYVLEVDLAKDIVDDWLEIAGKARISDAGKFFVITHYAENDCWPDPPAAEVYPQEVGAVRPNLLPPARTFIVGTDGDTHQITDSGFQPADITGD